MNVLIQGLDHLMVDGSLQLSNFRQYGQMKKQRWEESEKRREEKRREEERRCRCAKRYKSCEAPYFFNDLWPHMVV